LKFRLYVIYWVFLLSGGGNIFLLFKLCSKLSLCKKWADAWDYIAEGSKNEHSTAALSLWPEHHAAGYSSPRDTGATEELSPYLKSCSTRADNSEFPVLSIHPLPISSFFSSCNSPALTSLPLQAAEKLS